MRKKLYVLSLLPICVQMAYVQQKAQLSGTLVDEKSKTPIIGAVVSLEKSVPIKFNEATLKLLREICLFGSIEMDMQVNSLILRGQK